jgi:UDP-N-acetylmuramoylalanine--D-glutamate ligase
VDAAGAVAALQDCDVVVRSPGVSIYRPELRALTAAGVPITTATALWLAERGGSRVIGVTGTKGKSTTAMLVSRVIGSTGSAAHLAGNIGAPALDLLDAPASDWAVVELSSYQAADLETGPAVAVVTNLYREHADWHGDEETYRRDKLRLVGLPGVQAGVLPDGLDVACPGKTTLRFGSSEGWHVGSDGVRHPDAGFVPAAAFPLRGPHNAANLCAALTAVDAAELPRPDDLAAALSAIDALPHRLESVGMFGGVEWIDDSISTTPESAIAAIEAFPDREVVLIAGGYDRGQDYASLGQAVADRSVVVIAVPSTGARILAGALAAGASEERCLSAPDLPAAVRLARALAPAGSVALLSPAAPSFDSYRDFEERGDHFAALAAEP